MYKNLPKILMKVSLKGEKELEIILISINNYYSDNSEKSKTFFANSGFMIFPTTRNFTMFKTGSISLPKSFKIGHPETCNVTFDSDKDRYEFLRKMKNALLDWSRSDFWKEFNDPKKIKISYSNNLWIVF